MTSETNQDVSGTDAGGEGGEAKADPRDTELTDLKTQLKDRDSTIGSLKRDLKDAQKPKEPKETPQQTKESSDTLSLNEKAFLRASGIKGADEYQLAQDFKKRTGLDIDVVVEDEIFLARLEKLRTTKDNETAAQGGTNRGSDGNAARGTAEYWLAKLGPNDQVPADLPRDLRFQIVQARRKASSDDKMFYND